MYKAVAVLLFCLCLVIASVSLSYSHLGTKASVFFRDSVTADSLRNMYTAAEGTQKPKHRFFQRKSERKEPEKVNILVVPGHDAEYTGTEYKGIREVDLTLDLGEKLYTLLQKEPEFNVRLTQTKAGYASDFVDYFEKNRQGIQKFIEDQRSLMDQYVEAGRMERITNVIHNFAPGDMGLRLFGINKWANENGIDIMIHIHFNDYPGRKQTVSGKYSGFSIYVPEGQYSNAKGSKAIAESIHNRLKNFYPSSDLPKEDSGVVEDQELIAIGSNNSLDAASVLIEYGYIYEPGIADPNLRDAILNDLALQTYLGIMDFFGKSPTEGGEYDSRLLPYEWNEDLEKGDESEPDVLSLQAALVTEGLYPPAGENKNGCPLSGRFGPCTKQSVQAFQEKYGIEPATGFVGEQTRTKLNELY